MTLTDSLHSFLSICIIAVIGIFHFGWSQISSNEKNLIPLTHHYDFVFAVVKYRGGGDWYEGKVGVIELMKFVNDHKIMDAYPYPIEVELDAYNIYDYPFLYMTGHSDFLLNQTEVKKLQNYFERGGFLYINDDYGMDKNVHSEIKKVFPYSEWKKIPINHPIYNLHYRFPRGTPKIHKHDGGAPETYAITQNSKIVVLYTKNTDIGDGWAPYQVHKNPENIREQALRFGLNIILYSFLK